MPSDIKVRKRDSATLIIAFTCKSELPLPINWYLHKVTCIIDDCQMLCKFLKLGLSMLNT